MIGLESGLKTAGQIQSEQDYDRTLVQVAQYFGKRQDGSKVIFVVDKIHAPYMKAVGLTEAAEAMTTK